MLDRIDRPRRPLSLLSSLVRVLLWLAILGVLAVEAVAWILPQDFSDRRSAYLRFVEISFFARVFQLHIGLGVLGIVAVALLFRAWQTAGLAAMLAFGFLLPYGREFAPKRPPPPTSPTLRLMSVNLYVTNRDADAIERSIRAADPDVIVLCEVTPWSAREIVRGRLARSYPHLIQSFFDGGADVLSRVPIRQAPSVVRPDDPSARRPIVFAVGGREVALYPVHLVSPGSRWLVGRNRAQVESFDAIARAEQRPMLIVGDFNFPQLAPNAARLRENGLRSTHELAGFGLGNTWGPKWWPALYWMPGVRIDHIYLSRGLTATRHEVGLDTGSDHRPVVAEIALTHRMQKAE